MPPNSSLNSSDKTVVRNEMLEVAFTACIVLFLILLLIKHLCNVLLCCCCRSGAEPPRCRSTSAPTSKDAHGSSSGGQHARAMSENGVSDDIWIGSMLPASLIQQECRAENLNGPLSWDATVNVGSGFSLRAAFLLLFSLPKSEAWHS